MAVHTDGTIFAIQGVNTAGVSVIGIDPITGTQKFSVPLAVQPYNNLSEDLPCSIGTVFGPVGVSAFIVAGDGNAYLGYDYPEVKACSADPWTTHVRLLRISSSGAYDKITLADVSAGNYGAQTEIVGVQTITNGDTGVLATWSIFWPGDVAHGGPPGMAIVAGTSVSPVNPPQVPAQCGASVVSPGLQAQDGSFVGTVATCTETSSSPVMVAFDATGNVRWTVPNEQPMIATADGGVIGQSGITYGPTGNATGLSNLNANVSPGWLGNVLGSAYVVDPGTLFQITAPNTNYATTFGAFLGGNASWSGSAISWVMSKWSPSDLLKQLPDLSYPVCYPLSLVPIVLPFGYLPTCGNINAIELLTDKSPDFIFQNFIQTFAPVSGNNSSIMNFAGGLSFSNSVNVTAPGQILTIKLKVFPY